MLGVTTESEREGRGGGRGRGGQKWREREGKERGRGRREGKEVRMSKVEVEWWERRDGIPREDSRKSSTIL